MKKTQRREEVEQGNVRSESRSVSQGEGKSE
jgi:hypothetical protein